MSLPALAQILRARTGLEVSQDRLLALQEPLQLLAAPLGWPAFLARLRTFPLESPAVQAVVELVTVAETFFFRDEAHFEALEKVILPRLIEENRACRELKILSLGCATGEEPYSLAILLKRLLPRAVSIREKGQEGLPTDSWAIHLVGVDICTGNLDFARKGMYGPWSFRGVSEAIKNRYFARHSASWELLPEVRELVRFVPLNVVQGIGLYYESIDLILWRNMSIYLSPEARHSVTLHCQKALRRGGYLLVGSSEIGRLGPCELVTSQAGQTWFYQRPHPSPSRRLASAPGCPQPSGADVGTARPFPRARRKAAGPRTPPRPLEATFSASPGKAAAPVDSLERLDEARQLANQGRYDEALELLAPAGKGPRSLESHYLLAQIEEARGGTRAAEEHLQQTLKIDRDFILGHFLLGLSYSHRGQFRKALRYLERTHKLLTELSPAAFVPLSEGRSAEGLRKTTEQALIQLEGKL